MAWFMRWHTLTLDTSWATFDTTLYLPRFAIGLAIHISRYGPEVSIDLGPLNIYSDFSHD